MPGYDRTGPLGQGPRTGRGLGRCGSDKAVPTDATRPLRIRRGEGPGSGMGDRRRGGGRRGDGIRRS